MFKMESVHKDLKIHLKKHVFPSLYFKQCMIIYLFLHYVSHGQPLELLGHNEVNLTGY